MCFGAIPGTLQVPSTIRLLPTGNPIDKSKTELRKGDETTVKAGAQANSTVAQTICFSRNKEVRGAYRYRDLFQLLPIPDHAVHAPVIASDHPFILQYKYSGCPDRAEDSVRRTKKRITLTRILNVACNTSILSRSRYLHFFWSSFCDEGMTSKWLQEDYRYPGFQPFLTSFDELSSFPRMKMYSKIEYYSGRFTPEVLDEVALPDSIDEYLDKVFALNADDSRRFSIASTWFSQLSNLWMESNSSAFVALVSAIEALIDKTSEVCETCHQPKFSITKRFKDFLEEYVPDVKRRFPKEVRTLYRVRSNLAHGVDLLSADIESWNLFSDARQRREYVMQQNAHEIASTALVNWLLSR